MSNVGKSTIILMIATMLAKILGFIREQVLSYAYGLSMYTDVYITAMTIPTVIFAGIGVAIATTFIPIYCDIDSKYGEENAVKFSNNILIIVILICLMLSILGMIFTEPLVKVFAVGFTGKKLKLAIEFTRIIIISLVAIGVSNIITAYLQVKDNFFIPGISTIPQNLMIIASIIISMNTDVKVMVWGSLIGIVLNAIFQIPFAYKLGFKYKPYINIKDKNIKKMIVLVGPVFIGVAVNQINSIVDRTLATTLDQGLLASLSYANRLNEFVISMFIASIATVIYPMLSKLSINNNKDEFKKSISESINIVILLMIPISIGAMVLSKPIVRVLFERGAFDENATNITAIALTMYSIGMTAFGLRNILDKVFYSLKDTKTPMKNGIITVVLNIFLNIILVKKLGHAGLALATSISGIVCIIIFCNSLNKKIGYFGQKSIIKTGIKSILAGIVMGVCTCIVFNKLDIMLGRSLINQLISLLVSIIVGAIIYGTMILILKVDEVTKFVSQLKRKIDSGC